jgi:hypothetical protein
MPHLRHDRSALATWMFQIPGFLVFGIMLMGGKRRKTAWRYGLLTLVMGFAMLATACGGGSTPATKPPAQTGTAPGTYTLLVTATSGSVNHTLPLTLTVQ